jgi:Taurine catabolism dioxygenase TauD, TfdA family
VLGCQSTGAVRSPTLLLDTLELRLSGPERELAYSAVFCVRNGRRSFYASMLGAARPFLRVDPGCMEPIGEDGVEAMKLFSYEREGTSPVAFDWAASGVLIIDNWRVLHGRGNDAEADIGRYVR